MVEDSFDDILTWSDGNPLVIFCYLDLILTVPDIAKLYWDFHDALRRKSLCCFPLILRIRKQKLKTL